MKNLLLFAGLAISLFPVSTAAQTTEPVLVKLANVVNPSDGYHGGGLVQVRVAVNEQGEVTDAEFVSGPGAVCGWVTRPDVTKTRDAAVALMRKSKFTPATSGGVPVASSTIIFVDFAPSISKQREKVMGDRNYTAVKSTEKYTLKGNVVNDPPKTDNANTNPPDAEKYSVNGNQVSAASNVPPPKPLVDVDGGETISGGVLNGKAIELPKPRYPAAARAVRATGAVQVQVLIDEDGNVFLAQAVGGHPLLHAASVTAACSSKFQPTLLSGQPVKVSGFIVYNFVP